MKKYPFKTYFSSDVTTIFETSRDWDELEWMWKSWRDQSGKLMKKNYKKLVGLENDFSQSIGRFCIHLIDSVNYYYSLYYK